MSYRKTITDHILILDIDETLVHTSDDEKAWINMNIYRDSKSIDIRDRMYTLNIDTTRSNGPSKFMWGSKRPHLNKFLNFCFLYFKAVVVWSAGVYEYVHLITEDIFKDTQEPHVILTRSNCVGNINHLEKPFWKMIHDTPDLTEYINYDLNKGFKNVFIIDDRLSSFAQNPKNGINIPLYDPKDSVNDIRKDDVCLLQLMNWFSQPDVINSDDVRTLDKSKIFTTHIIPEYDHLHMATGHQILNKNITFGKEGIRVSA